ncbi:amino acid adenylation domain-containing protein [Actinoallomurus sp. NPDC052308]|uniref:non-ribosomal peptide synthetase n=1 Tax=Actinoallomurus sp. NPDC052308 TaxID=3155530 RepID=UPI00342934EB
MTEREDRHEDVRRALLDLRWRRSRAAQHAAAPITPVDRGGRHPLTFEQERLWFDAMAGLPPEAAVEVVAVRLHGLPDAVTIRRSLAAAIARHEPLRTRFGSAHGVPHQIVDPPPDDLPSDAVPVVDLRGADGPDRDRRCAEVLRAAVEHPFDLAAGPLLRFRLLLTGADESVLVVAAHRIVADAFSLRDVVREVCGRVPWKGGGPAAQSVDFAAWQRAYRGGEHLERELDHWTERLADLPVLDLPTDAPRPARRSWAGAVHESALPPELYAKVRGLADPRGVLLAGLLLVLARYTGQDDFAAAVVVDGRTHEALRGAAGPYARTLVVRADLSGDPAFGELVRRAEESLTDALDHRDMPYGMLADALGADPAQVAFSLVEGVHERFGELAVEEMPIACGGGRFDLTLQVVETPDGGARLRLAYATELFEADRIERLAGHLRTALDAATDDPDRPVGRVPILGDDERRRMLWEWNPQPRPHPTDGRLLHEVVAERAAERPDAPAVRFEGRTVSYAELTEGSDRLARLLAEEHGVGTGRLVALLLDRGPDAPVAQLAVVKAGGAWLPLDPGYPPKRIAFQLEDSRADLVITTSALADRLPDGVDLLLLDDDDLRDALASREAGPPPCPAGADDLAYVIYTSGSTGTPKGVMISHRAVVNFVANCRDLFGITPDDRILQFANLAFDVSVFDIYAALGHGAVVVAAPREELLDPDRLTALMREERVTLSDLPPAVLKLLDPEALPDLRALFVGLEPFPGELVNRWNTEGRQFHNGYGPTEATVACIDYRCPHEPLRAMPPIGRAMGNHRAYVLDRNFEPVPVGVPGELFIGGTGLARGYLNRAELTAERFIKDPFVPGERMYRTGDLVRWRSDGNLQFVGRADDQIKIRGLRIEPGEVEHALTSRPEVREAAVAAQDGPGGQRLVAYVVGDGFDVDALRDGLADELPAHMVPAELIPLDEIPRNASGKLDKSRLPAAGEGGSAGPARDNAADRPPTATERTLIELIRDVLELGDDPVGPGDNYFSVGGNSLNLIRLLNRIEEQTGVRLENRDVLLAQDIRKMASLVDERGGGGEGGATEGDSGSGSGPATPDWLVPIRTEGDRTPFFCMHPSGGSAVPYLRLAGLLDERQPFYGIEAVGLHGEADPPDVPAMAARYLEAVRQVQPHGPYLLGGWSIGGTLAFEMARQLQADGETVRLVVLMDSAVPPQLKEPPTHTEMLESFAHDLSGLQGKEPPRVDWERIVELPPEEQTAEVVDALEHSGRIPADIRDELGRRIQVFMANAATALTYRPGHYDGSLVSLGAKEGQYDGGWEPLVSGDIVERTVPGTHYTMLQQPNVDTLAAELGRILDEAAAGRETGDE